MPGEFIRVGEANFPGRADIPCSLYEWRSTNPRRHGKFKVQFLSPDENCGPRRYWVVPLLNLWMEGKPTRFVEKACDYGYKILAEIEGHDASTRDAYRCVRRIFRNRNAGHVSVDRRFACAADFLDFSRPGSPQLILPGVDLETSPFHTSGTTVHAQAAQLLKRALSKTQPNGDSGKPRFERVLSVYERFVAEAGRSSAREGKSDHASNLFVTKTIPAPDFQRIDELVRSSLIAGPVTNEDFQCVEADERKLCTFVSNLEKKALGRYSPLEFDRWLKRVRHEGYLQLIGGRQLTGTARVQAKEEAQRIFCWLLWHSYHMMAKCYGTLMTLISVDFAFNNRDRTPDKVEQSIFDLEHRQVDFLGELPLAFLGSPQLRWIVRVLHKLEACLVQEDFRRYQATWGNREDAFADIPMLLGIYGTLNRDRRAADRNAKRRGGDGSPLIICQGAGHLENAMAAVRDPADAALAAEEAGRPLEQLHSTKCPKNSCGAELSVAQIVDGSNPRQSIVELYCCRCDESSRYAVDLAEFATNL